MLTSPPPPSPSQTRRPPPRSSPKSSCPHTPVPNQAHAPHAPFPRFIIAMAVAAHTLAPSRATNASTPSPTRTKPRLDRVGITSRLCAVPFSCRCDMMATETATRRLIFLVPRQELLFWPQVDLIFQRLPSVLRACHGSYWLVGYCKSATQSPATCLTKYQRG
ncbi:unnamed protein product [Urochloa humidicola]